MTAAAHTRGALRNALAFAAIALAAAPPALGAVRGDVNLDGVVDPADVLVLRLYINGETALDEEALDAADVAPVNATTGEIEPDGSVGLGDLIVLVRGIRGDVTFPTPPATPSLDALDPGELGDNPITINGDGPADTDILLYVNGELQRKVHSDVSTGEFSFSVAGGNPVILLDGDNTILVVAEDGTALSASSNALSASYENQVGRTNPTVSSGITVWTSGDPNDPNDIDGPYLFSANLQIPANATLYLTRGVELRFASGTELAVKDDGVLRVLGRASASEQDPEEDFVVFTSQGSGWLGIDIEDGGTANISHGRIEEAQRAVDVDSASLILADSSIVSAEGVYLRNGANSQLDRNYCEPSSSNGKCIALIGAGSFNFVRTNTLTGCGDGITVTDSSPAISGNDISGCTRGIVISGTSDLVGTEALQANSISGNCTGVLVSQSDPDSLGLPTIAANENTISGNACGTPPALQNLVFFHDPGNANYKAYPTGTVFDGERNSWGSTDPFTVAGGVIDNAESTSLPTLDFVPFLDAAHDSTPPPSEVGEGSLLVGIVDDSVSALSSGDYTAVGTLVVPAAATWTLPSDSNLDVYPGAGIEVLGDLVIAGTQALPSAVFSSLSPGAAGDWRGIVVHGAAASADLEHASVLHAETGLSVDAGHLDVSDSLVDEFVTAGIVFTGSATGTVYDSTVGPNGGSTATGIVLEDSSPTIGSNTITGLDIGIEVRGNASPLIATSPTSSSGNVITGHSTSGIRLTGTPAGDPSPTINDNEIYSNGNNNIKTLDFSPGGSGVIDAKRNYWGTTTPQEIHDSIKHNPDNPISFDVSEFRDASGTIVGGTSVFATLIANIRPSVNTFAPTPPAGASVDILFDTPTVATLTVDIYRESVPGQPGTDPTRDAANRIRRFVEASAAAGAQTITWDGKDESGDYVGDDAYVFVVNANDGSVDDTYDPPRPTGGTVSSGPGTTSTFAIDPHKNQFWTLVYDHVKPDGRFTLQIGQGGSLFEVPSTTAVPIPANTADKLIVYDGRGSDQRSFLQGTEPFALDLVSRLKPNFVIVEKTTPQIEGPGVGGDAGIPDIEVTASPYLVRQSYDQMTTIRYTLDRDACVTIYILRPDFSDDPLPGDILATIVDDAERAGGVEHAETWRESDTLSELDATHTFMIRAMQDLDPDPGEVQCEPDLETVYLGTVQVRR